MHPEPELRDSAAICGISCRSADFELPKDVDRKAIAALLASVKGKPRRFAINLAVLKSLTRAEYSPEVIGHFALASEHYGHFTSPIRRYADLTIHRLLDAYFEARGGTAGGNAQGGNARNCRSIRDEIPSYDDLVELGKHLSLHRAPQRRRRARTAAGEDRLS